MAALKEKINKNGCVTCISEEIPGCPFQNK
jgi:hypothetical protein